jgi:hypothetical protein
MYWIYYERKCGVYNMIRCSIVIISISIKMNNVANTITTASNSKPVIMITDSDTSTHYSFTVLTYLGLNPPSRPKLNKVSIDIIFKTDFHFVSCNWKDTTCISALKSLWNDSTFAIYLSCYLFYRTSHSETTHWHLALGSGYMDAHYSTLVY